MSECDSGRRVTFWCHNHGSPWRVGQDGCDFARAEKAEAALQRVRELPILGKAPQGNTALRGYNDGWNSCRMATLRALDGDA